MKDISIDRIAGTPVVSWWWDLPRGENLAVRVAAQNRDAFRLAYRIARTVRRYGIARVFCQGGRALTVRPEQGAVITVELVPGVPA